MTARVRESWQKVDRAPSIWDCDAWEEVENMVFNNIRALLTPTTPLIPMTAGRDCDVTLRFLKRVTKEASDMPFAILLSSVSRELNKDLLKYRERSGRSEAHLPARVIAIIWRSFQKAQSEWLQHLRPYLSIQDEQWRVFLAALETLGLPDDEEEIHLLCDQHAILLNIVMLSAS